MKNNSKYKRYFKIVKVLKKLIIATKITKSFFDLEVNIIICKLLTLIFIVEK